MRWLKGPRPQPDLETMRKAAEAEREKTIAAEELLRSLRQRELCRISWEFGSAPLKLTQQEAT